MKNIIFVYLILLFYSCGKLTDSVNFKIKNSSNINYDSLYITNFHNKSTYKFNLKPNDSVELNLNFKEVKIKGDGSYGIIYFKDEDSIFHHFGYFTNGIPLSEEFNINILEDTIQINEVVKKL